MSLSISSLRKQPTFGDATTGFPAKWRLRNEHRNSIMMTRRYPDLASASDWSCRVGNLIQPIRSTTQIWVVTRHQYGISALVSQTSFGGETSGSIAKCRLFSQATVFQSWVHSSLYLHIKNFKPDQHLTCLCLHAVQWKHCRTIVAVFSIVTTCPQIFSAGQCLLLLETSQ